MGYIADSDMSKMFFFDDWKSRDYFWKQFISGAFIAIVMTGLDQDMMQKNLTCRNLGDAQKNMFWFTIILTIANFMFLALGFLLTDYAEVIGITAQKDDLYPAIATSGELGMEWPSCSSWALLPLHIPVQIVPLTALTTSFSIDILDIEKKI
jgi:solute:Na+ symporter, SSS family